MQTMFVELFLNVGVKPEKLNISSVLHSVHHTGDVHPDKTVFFFLSEVYREFGAKIVEIKVLEINAPLNLRREN